MPVPELAEEFELFRLRELMYTFFHKALSAKPCIQTLTAMSDSEVLKCMSFFAKSESAISILIRHLTQVRSEMHISKEVLEHIQQEYANFFIGPKKLFAIPWEYARNSEGLLFSEKTLRIREIYRAEGFEPKEVRKVADDHISLEICFMKELSKRTLIACQDRLSEEFGCSLKAQESFLDNHLLTWIPNYKNEAMQTPSAYFYPQMISAMEEYLLLDSFFLKHTAFSLLPPKP
jgi:TorA maturation chaperone TorD